MLHSIIMAIIGGALIGLAASVMLLFVGRIAGISGILGGLLQSATGDRLWRIVFLGGLLAGGILMLFVLPQSFATPTSRHLPTVAIAGLLVGFGTRMGNGCTSGHGVCGLTRFSKRSLVATVSFMITGVIVATGMHALGGGLS